MRKETVMNTRTVWTSLVVVPGLLAALAGCSGETYPVEVTGDTGACSESEPVWSGDPLPLAGGTVLERTVSCPGVTTSDERTTGAVQSTFRCEFSEQGDSTVGDCVSDSTLTNDGGTWHAPQSRITITLTVGEPTTVVHDSVYVGAGDYEGLRYTNRVTNFFDGTEHDYPWQVTGTIDQDG
jgi:hypothetical protein